MPPAHRAHAEWSPERMKRWANKIGPHTMRFIERLIASRAFPEQAYRACLGVLRLGYRYGEDRLEKACAIAYESGATRYQQVELILKNKLDAPPSFSCERIHPLLRHMKISVVLIIINNNRRMKMLNQPTLDKLRALKLTGMAEAFCEQLQKPIPDLDFESRLGLLIDREWYLRENRRLNSRLSQAKLQQSACVEDIDFKHPRGLNKSAIQELARGQWIQQHLNLLITGPTGCGKTYLACALAHKACLIGFTARYYRLPRLWHELKIAKANGTYANWLSQLAKIDVLLLDDWGLGRPTMSSVEIYWKC